MQEDLLKVLEYTAICFNVIYLLLAIRVNIWCWLFGIIGVILSFFVYVHDDIRLYSDASLQVVYLGLSIYGWMTWGRKNSGEEKFVFRRMKPGDHLIVIILGGVGTFLLGTFWEYFNASLPFWDAATTSFAVLTTILVVRKYIENWIYWIVIDLICVVLYYYKNIEGFALLFLFYAVMAAWGYRNWKAKARHYLE